MLFKDLIEKNSAQWDNYIHHAFVKKLQDGSLPKEVFLFYLKQDYLFLLHYAKAYATLALNATNANELRFAMKFQNAIINGEIELHKNILQLGIDTKELSIKDESLTTIAYTRYVLNVGQSGDFLDMLIALSACAIGYGYIGTEMIASIDEKTLHHHPYKEWILTYSSQEFQTEIKEFEDFVNSYQRQINTTKFNRLNEIFYTAVRLETAFWEHSMKMQMDF
ncbi:thiaminase II [Campylobacter sp. MIT 21-1685]|uniref:thiaminase II n=1 Tax=unclassified Campylobacter TaxID=2593542 RepID=UPI00224AC319|nr:MULTISPECIES: thiaminase II [unclassified Campylobacter]MCX2682845.1 thiaminase II [Campylobacter sp. MIT 21-1684]MCX2751207.1 thiaminase II [Campylobacter sp. MIT 21-1682]MCX2807326.1 thiaminase II [Campylobacter sp. MIT 21-1685]